MYITAMWLRSPATGERGVNVTIYRHPNGLPDQGDPERIAENPGQEVAVRYNELRPGGNYVQAFLDLVLEDVHYDRDAINSALERIENNEFLRHTSNPLRLTEQLKSNAELKVVFGVNIGFEDPESKRAIFSLLRGTTTRVLAQRMAA
jgi:hypothetical protein